MCGTTSHVWGGSGGRHGAAHEQHRYARDSQTARRKHHGTTEARLCGVGIAASHATRVHWRNEWAANAPQPERENEKHEIVFRALRPDETPAAGCARRAKLERACRRSANMWRKGPGCSHNHRHQGRVRICDHVERGARAGSNRSNTTGVGVGGYRHARRIGQRSPGEGRNWQNQRCRRAGEEEQGSGVSDASGSSTHTGASHSASTSCGSSSRFSCSRARQLQDDRPPGARPLAPRLPPYPNSTALAATRGHSTPVCRLVYSHG